MQAVAAVAGALSVAESYPTSEVRGSGVECQAAMAQEWLRGATPCPRSGVMARRRYPVSEARDSDQEKPPHIRGWAKSERSHPASEARGGVRKEQSYAQDRGGDQEKQSYIKGVVAVRVQEGLEKPSHNEGEEGRQ